MEIGTEFHVAGEL